MQPWIIEQIKQEEEESDQPAIQLPLHAPCEEEITRQREENSVGSNRGVITINIWGDDEQDEEG